LAASYVQTGKRLHMAYSFGLLGSRMTHHDVSETVKRVEQKLGDGWLCWATSNHDTVRVVSRMHAPDHLHKEAALMVMALGLSLRGSYCMYQGEELGLPQAKLAFEDLRDPYDISLYPEHAGRDGGRTPMPWHKEKPNGGFSFAPETWIKFWEPHRDLAVSVQEHNSDSVLNHYRRMIGFRKQIPALRDGDIHVLDTPEPIVAWVRKTDDYVLLCIFNLSPDQQNWTLPDDNTYSMVSGISNGSEISVENDRQVVFHPYGFGFFGCTQPKA
ncbi:MAG TPA: alpha-amylase family glycosyl hydrolase, partial [Alphaproteobacteria bacterium]|nr:alpha-amylase family glycosyl hydrolase [Alphaproteobacteria bacterium]